MAALSAVTSLVAGMASPAATPSAAVPKPMPAGWLPGASAPSYLDGKLPGDVGFDPLCLVALAPTGTAIDGSDWKRMERKTLMVMATPYEQQRKVRWMREAEIKHARLAMVAAAGWPLSEIFQRLFRQLTGSASIMDATNGRAPSLFNGHLLEGPQGIFVLLAALATAALELKTLDNVEGLTPTEYVAGDLGFDPAGLRSKRSDMEVAEIKNGRLAMMAITGMAVQEFFYGTAVVDQTPGFFQPTLPF